MHHSSHDIWAKQSIVNYVFLIYLFLQGHASALYSSASYSLNGAESTTIGCMAADFTAAPTDVGLDEPTDLIVADPITMCSYSTYYQTYVVHIDATVDYEGKVVYIERSNCDPTAIGSVLTYFGAAGLIVGNVYEGEISWTFSVSVGYFYIYLDYNDDSLSYFGFLSTIDFVDSDGNLELVVCLTSYEESEEMLDLFELSSDYDHITIDASGIVDNDLWDTAPQHINTIVRFDWEVNDLRNSETTIGAYSAPAAQALFNIPNSESKTAEVVKVEIASICKQLSYYSECLNCWAASTPFANAAELDGKIAFLTADSLAILSCYYFYYEITYEAQLAGAVGVIFGESNDVQSIYEPVGVPFEAHGNTFGVLYATASQLESILSSENAKTQVSMTATLPELDSWTPPSGPEYYPSTETSEITEGVLNVTTIFMQNPSATIRDDTGTTSAPQIFKPLTAGQSAFEPAYTVATSGTVAVAEITSSCRRSSECDSCVLSAQNGAAISTSGEELLGRVAILNASHFLCLDTAHELALEAQLKGAIACVVINRHDVVYTESSDALLAMDGSAAVLEIPYFNVGMDSYLDALEALGSTWESQVIDEVTLYLPAMTDHIASWANATQPANNDICSLTTTTDLPLTEIILGASVQGSSLSYFNVGQATYNPMDHPGVYDAPIVFVELASQCTDLATCGSCDRLDSPFIDIDYGSIQDSVAIFSIETELCFPVYYFSKYLQSVQALGALVSNNDQSLLTLDATTYHGACPEMQRLESILTFDMSAESAAEIAELYNDEGSLATILPYTGSSGVAPESIEDHYASWLGTVDGGPEDGGGETFDEEEELPQSNSSISEDSVALSIEVIGEWSPWSACSIECFGVSGYFPGVRTRERNCTAAKSSITRRLRRFLVSDFIDESDDTNSGCDSKIVTEEVETCNAEDCDGRALDTATANVQLYFPSSQINYVGSDSLIDLHDNNTILSIVLPGLADDLEAEVSGLDTGELYSQYFFATYGAGKDGDTEATDDACYLQVSLMVLQLDIEEDGKTDEQELALIIEGLGYDDSRDLSAYTWLSYLDPDYIPTDQNWGTFSTTIENDGASTAAAIVISVILVVVILVVVTIFLVKRRRRALRLAVYGGVTTSVQTVKNNPSNDTNASDSEQNLGLRGPGSNVGPGRVIKARPYVPAKKQKTGPTTLQMQTIHVQQASTSK